MSKYLNKSLNVKWKMLNNNLVVRIVSGPFF